MDRFPLLGTADDAPGWAGASFKRFSLVGRGDITYVIGALFGRLGVPCGVPFEPRFDPEESLICSCNSLDTIALPGLLGVDVPLIVFFPWL